MKSVGFPLEVTFDWLVKVSSKIFGFIGDFSDSEFFCGAESFFDKITEFFERLSDFIGGGE